MKTNQIVLSKKSLLYSHYPDLNSVSIILHKINEPTSQISSYPTFSKPISGATNFGPASCDSKTVLLLKRFFSFTLFFFFLYGLIALLHELMFDGQGVGGGSL